MTPLLPFAMGAVVVAVGLFLYPDPTSYRRVQAVELKVENGK